MVPDLREQQGTLSSRQRIMVNVRGFVPGIDLVIRQLRKVYFSRFYMMKEKGSRCYESMTVLQPILLLQ